MRENRGEPVCSTHGAVPTWLVSTLHPLHAYCVRCAWQLGKRLLSEVADAERGRELSACKLRVVDANSVLKAAFVVVDRIDVERRVALVRLPEGTAAHEVAFTKLELHRKGASATSAAAEGAAAMHESSVFRVGEYVKVVAGQYAKAFGERSCPVVRVLMDERYELHLEGHGNVIMEGGHLCTTTVKFAQRPMIPFRIPDAPPGTEWSDSQMDAFDAILRRNENAAVSGEPGSGKTEVEIQCIKVLQGEDVKLNCMAQSNAIVSFLIRRFSNSGVADADKIVGTYSRTTWASLGDDYQYERVAEMVNYLVTSPHTKMVVKGMREAQVLFLEEDQNTAVHFKDVMSRVYSGVCGYAGPEPFANKQVIYIRDPRQLGAIEVEDGNAKSVANFGLLPGGVMIGGGQAKEVLSIESQITQHFYTKQPVVIESAHYVDVPGATAQAGTVVRYCSLRDKFLVSTPNASSHGLAGMGSEALIKVEYVKEQHLASRVPRVANYTDIHLTGSKRVSFGQYDASLPPASQSAEALWHRSMGHLHCGQTDTADVREVSGGDPIPHVAADGALEGSVVQPSLRALVHLMLQWCAHPFVS